MDSNSTGAPNLAISADKIRFIQELSRRFDVKVAVTDPDPGSNATDDEMVDVLEDTQNDAIQSQLTSCIHDLNVDEQIDLVALAWLGRGDGDLSDWSTLRITAQNAHNSRTAAYLMGLPLISDYLEEGLSLVEDSAENP